MPFIQDFFHKGQLQCTSVFYMPMILYRYASNIYVYVHIYKYELYRQLYMGSPRLSICWDLSRML